jgi:hypothetical protein
VQRYSDQIGLALTIGALLWSGLTAFRSARRQSRRNRIETHYEAARRMARAAADARSESEIEDARRDLIDARERALMELEGSQLDANDAFMVLQRFLDTAIAEIDRRPPPRP